MPERSPRHKSAKTDRELKKSAGPKVVTKSDLYSIPGNKHAAGKTKHSTPREITPKKRVQQGPKRQHNQSLHSIPRNSHAGAKTNYSTSREMNKSPKRAAKSDATVYRSDKSKQNRGHGHKGNQPGPKQEKRGRTKGKGGDSPRVAKR